jgi:superfamily II DNA or RNA helicase
VPDGFTSTPYERAESTRANETERPTLEKTGPRPRLRLFRDRVVDCRDDPEGIESDAPLLALSFDYDGVNVKAADESPRFFRSSPAGVFSEERDHGAEARARRVLESFGAVDLACLDELAVSPDSAADYLLCCDGDVHDFCGFSAFVVPKLRALGFTVDVDDDYPYQVVEKETSFYAEVRGADDRPDWFALELGVEVDGQRINLVPVLLDLLEDAPGKSFRALAKRSLRCVALPVSGNRYVTLPKERLATLLSVVVELHQGERRTREELYFPELSAHALERLEAAFREGGHRFHFSGARVEDLGERRSRPDAIVAPPPVATPEGLRATLRPYQKDGLAWLQSLVANDVGGVLADDMGLGKTLQTIAHIAIEKAAGRLDKPALVVAPTSLVGTWSREMRKFAPHLEVLVLHGSARHEAFARWDEADVIVTTYPLLVRDEARFEGKELHLVILDEAHTVKNTRSQAHRAVKRLNARHRLCLTGTPVENHLGELWSLMDFLNPGMLGDELGFRRWYRRPIEELGDEQRLDALKQQVRPFLLRRTKAEVAKDLPPKTTLNRPVELEGRQRELYESIRVAAHADVRKVIRSKGLVGSTISILDALMKLRQVCCDPRLCRMDAAKGIRRSAKLDQLFRLLEAKLENGHRVLVFSQFTSMLALIAHGLRERDRKYLALTGATQKRQAVVDAFESGKADVFLISLKAGGTGLTLTSADTVVHYDPWWNPAAQDQATDRAYRIGQTKPVLVHNLFVAGSVEERMLELQAKKRRLADALLGDTARAPLTEADVEYLFAPLG